MTDQKKQITTIVQKLHAGERISREESLVLLQTGDIFLLGELANTIREKKNGQYTSYNINVHLNPSNICINGCSFCAFSRKEGDPEAFDLSLEEIIAQVKAKVTARTTELHIVGGVHPYKGLDFYTTVLAAIKKLYPAIYLKAFTATEVHHMAEVSGVSVKKALTALKASGLDSMPGGGAEVFAPRVRKKVCPQKISGELWLGVHRVAHSLGIKTNATMLYGHIETPEERVDHLFSLRNLQDKTGGFQAFIPLPYHPHHTSLGGGETSGFLDLTVHALSRIILDNFEHIKAYWVMTGTEMAQLLQSFGVDDLDGTLTEEKITHAAGAETPSCLDEDFLRYLIVSAGRIPIERDTLYNRVG